MTFLAGFAKRKAIKIATAGIPASDLAAFSKLFEIAGDTDIGGETTSQKLAVTLADGTTQVPYGALSFNVSGGAATLKIRAKFDLSHSWSNGDTIGYLYYDHTATDQSNKSGVLDSNRVSYWPLEEDPSSGAPQMLDWSGTNSLSSAGSMTSGESVAAQVANGISTDGVNDDVENRSFSGLGNFSNTAWTLGGIFSWQTGSGTQSAMNFAVGSGANYLNICIRSGGSILIEGTSTLANSGVSPTAGTKYHVVGRFSGAGNVDIFVNGTKTTGAAGAPVSFTPGILSIGQFLWNNGGFQYFDPRNGVSDECFADKTNRSDAWIGYDYTDEFSNSSTFTLGAEETAGGGPTVMAVISASALAFSSAPRVTAAGKLSVRADAAARSVPRFTASGKLLARSDLAVSDSPKLIGTVALRGRSDLAVSDGPKLIGAVALRGRSDLAALSTPRIGGNGQLRVRIDPRPVSAGALIGLGQVRFRHNAAATAAARLATHAELTWPDSDPTFPIRPIGAYHPELEAFAGRVARFVWKAFAADGVSPVPLGASDVVRFKLAKSEGGAPLLDLKLGAANDNGSQVLMANVRTLGGIILGPLDTSSFAGWYYDEVDYVAASDHQIKPIVRGRIYFHKSQAGKTDLSS